MPRKVANIPKVADDAEEYDITEEEEIHEGSKEQVVVKVSKRTGKPLLSEEERRQIRLENLEKAKRAKQEKNNITKTLKQSKKELTQLELQKQKEELEAIKQKIETMNTQKQQPKPKPKKKIIVQEEDEEEEEEEQVIVQPKRTRAQPVRRPVQQTQDVDYSNLVRQSAAEQIRKQLENERIKMAMLSIMPNYRFN